jgi:succinate dehydrogenase / fumarate reductase cytochrome b subunit
MTWLFSTFRRSIGKKQLMALTGLGLYAFLIVHLAGNLLIFAGAESFNGYARSLEENPLLIPAEAVLFLVFLAHIVLACVVTIENRRARPVRYVLKRREGGKTLASSTMFLSGALILVFLVLHLAHFKFASREGTTLYHLVVNTFHRPGYVAWYAVAMVVLGFHLYHGFQSAFRTLGLVHPRYTPAVVALSRGLAVVIAAGYIAIPLWIYFFTRPDP